MRSISVFFAVFFLLSLFSCDNSTSADDEGLLIRGTVLDYDTRLPLEDVYIYTDPATETRLTDKDGKFQIRAASQGEYIIHSELKDYISKATPAGANEERAVDIIILMQSGESANIPPTAPELLNPKDNSIVHVSSVKLYWQCTDPNGDDLKYSLYFDENNPPANLIASDLSDTVYDNVEVKPNTRYFWRVKAFDKYNAVSTSQIATFKTADTVGSINTDELILMLSFDNHTTDISGNSYDAVNYGGMFTQDRKGGENSAIHFNGHENSYAEIPYSNIFNVPVFTYAMWVKPSPGYGVAFKNYIDIIGRWGTPQKQSFTISILNTGNLATQFYDGSSFSLNTSQAVIPTDQWTHIAVTYQENICRMYINGNLELQYSVVFPRATDYTMLLAKRHVSSNGTHYKGGVDDLYIFGRVLSNDEIKVLAETD